MTDRTPTRAPAARIRREGGFSLVEVALALMVAAGGMVAVFALFPASMRQTVSARADMKGALFASTVLETIAGNVRQIDDIATWNDPQAWWEIAANGLFDGSGSAEDRARAKSRVQFSNAYTAEAFRKASKNNDDGLDAFSPATVDVAADYPVPSKVDAFYKDTILYFGREEGAVEPGSPIPPQFLIRFETIKRKALGKNGQELDNTFIPNRYLVSVVSSPNASPQIFVHEQIYAQEYYFVHRP